MCSFGDRDLDNRTAWLLKRKSYGISFYKVKFSRLVMWPHFISVIVLKNRWQIQLLSKPGNKKTKKWSDPDHIGSFAYEEMSLIKSSGVTEVINFCTKPWNRHVDKIILVLSFIPLELFLKELRNNIAWVRQTDFTASHKGIEKFKQQRRLTQRKLLKTTLLFERQEIIVLQVWHALW